MPKHGQGVNAVNDDCFVSSMNDLATPLLTIKQNLLRADMFPGCDESCQLCMSLPNGYLLLKMGVQCLMANKEILFEKVPLTRNSYEDVSIITISDNPPRVSPKRPVRITSVPKYATLIMTMSRPIPYSSDKVVP